MVEERGLHRQQVDDAHHRPVRLLHRLQLVDEVLQRPRDDLDVLEEEEARAERDRPRSTSAALAISAMTEPMVTAPCTAHHIRMNARWRLTELRSIPPLSSTKRHMAWAPAPFERRSSAAVKRSSMPPYSWASAPISSAASLIARCRIVSSTQTAAARYTSMPSPMRQSRTVSTPSMPVMSSTPPVAFGTTCERNSDTDVTSPSTRWISSPGVWARWNS